MLSKLLVSICIVWTLQPQSKPLYSLGLGGSGSTVLEAYSAVVFVAPVVFVAAEVFVASLVFVAAEVFVASVVFVAAEVFVASVVFVAAEVAPINQHTITAAALHRLCGGGSTICTSGIHPTPAKLSLVSMARKQYDGKSEMFGVLSNSLS